MNEQRKIVFYDGECGLCNKLVQFILKHEKDDKLYFSSLQSDFASSFLKKQGITINLDTMYFYDGTIFEKSTAALKVSTYLKWPWSIGNVLKVIPLGMRTWIYDFVAKNRKMLKLKNCMYGPKYNSRFIKKG